MAAPTSPYCASDDVAILVPQLVRNAGDFSTETNPTKVVIDKFIDWVSSQMDQAFAVAGYYVPYQEISGETWPTHQTFMLELMASFGVAGMVVGPVVKPAPSMGRDSGREDNAFTAAYKAFVESIPVNGAGFRMYYRPGTKAEGFCRAPQGPTTDYLEGYIDPTLFQTTDEYTTMIENLRQVYAIEYGSIPWDHLKTLRDSLGE